jgi:hypothetical protein
MVTSTLKFGRRKPSFIARYRDRDLYRCFRYAIRLPANDILHREIEHLMTRPLGRPPKAPIVLYYEFMYQAAEIAVSRDLFAAILGRIRRLRLLIDEKTSPIMASKQDS